MIAIPEKLLEQFERRNVLLFVGERILYDAEGRVFIDELARQLVSHGGISDAEALAFPEVAQAYQDSQGRQALVQFVREQLEMLDDDAQSVHHLIAGLTECNILVTTCLDRKLEQALAGAGRPLNVVTGHLDVVDLEDEHKAQLFKLRGSIERAESLLLTEDDYTFFEDQVTIPIVLQAYLACKTVLFIGFDLADPYFERLYRKVILPLDKYAQRAYACSESLPSRMARWCQRHGVHVIEAEATTFLEALAEKLAARSQLAPATSPKFVKGPTESISARPYKLLDYYETGDAAIFFGRQRETQILCSLIHAHRLVLLYGASGTGKTSLLLAGAIPLLGGAIPLLGGAIPLLGGAIPLLGGAIPHLERGEPAYQTLYVRALEDPALVIRRAIRQRLPEADLPEGGWLVDFLDAATNVWKGTLVIILDQFEEFFIRLSPQSRAVFISELGRLNDTSDVPVKVVISLREDWLALISEIEKRIPEVFSHKIRLLPLVREQAHQAITGPVERLKISYEPGLVEQLLDDLADSEGIAVMPPQLQLVCSALYSELQPDEHLITLAAYQRLGGARKVLQQYLDDALAQLEKEEQVLARDLLEELVTSERTKKVETLTELHVALDVEPAILDPVLEKLVRARLLRPVEQANTSERAYELAHEYLIGEIALSQEAVARKETEQLLKQEVDNWRRFDTLLSFEKLKLVDQQRDKLRLSREAQALLLLSALRYGHQIDYWTGRVADPQHRLAVLTNAAASSSAAMRRQTAMALGILDEPTIVSLLLELALRDKDPQVRQAAYKSLARLKQQRPMVGQALQSAMQTADRVTRSRILEALAGLPLAGLSMGLRLQVMATRVRLGMGHLRERYLATPIQRTVALLAIAIAVIVGVLYLVNANRYYLDVAPAQVNGAPSRVIVRQGSPSLALPGLNTTVIDTGFNLSQYTPDGQEHVVGKRLQGWWWPQAAEEYAHWGEDASDWLTPWEKARAYWYFGGQSQTLELIQVWTGTDVRPAALEMLQELAFAKPAIVSEQAYLTALVSLLGETNFLGQWNPTHWQAMDVLGWIVYTQPEVTPQLVEALRLRLADEDANVRRAAAQALGRVVNIRAKIAPEVVEALLPVLADEDEEVRLETVLALEQTVINWPQVAPKVVEALIPLLSDEDEDTRAGALQALGQAGVRHPTVALRVVEALQPLLADEDSGMRLQTALALGRVAANRSQVAPPVVEALLPMLSDENGNVRAGAVQALGQAGARHPSIAPQVVEALQPLLADNEAEVRYQAALALVQARDVPVEIVLQMVDAFVPMLFYKDSFTQVRLVQTLDQIMTTHPEVAPQVVEAIRPMLSVENSHTRYRAIQVLAQISRNNPILAFQAVDPLHSMLTDEDSQVRVEAVRALGQVGTAWPETVPQVVQSLHLALVDEEADVRLEAVKILGQLGDVRADVAPQVIELLGPVLTDEDENVRYWAAITLVQTGNVPTEIASRVVETLRLALADRRDEMLYIQTLEALKRVGITHPEVFPQVAEALLSLLADQNYNVRTGAAQAFEQIVASRPEIIPQLIGALQPMLAAEDDGMQYKGLQALAQIVGDRVGVALEVVEALRPMLADENANARFGAVEALGEIGDKRAEVALVVVETLRGMLTDSEANVRTQAIRSLGQVGTARPEVAPQVAEALRPMLSDNSGEVRSWAAMTLVQIGDVPPEIIPQVIETLLSNLSISQAQLGQLAVAQPEVAPQVIDALYPMLADEDSNLRYNAIQTLGHVGRMQGEVAPQIVEILRPMLADEDERVRGGTLDVLLQVAINQAEDVPQVLEALCPMLDDEDTNVREGAIVILEQIIMLTDAEITPQMVEALQPMLTDDDREMRYRIAAILAQSENVPTETIPPVIEALRPRLTDEDSGLRNGAIWKLETVGATHPEFTAQVVELLRPMVADEEIYVRDTTVRALGYLADTRPEIAPQVIEALRPALADEHREIRDNATSILVQTWTAQVQESGEITSTLSSLVNPLDSQERLLAGRVLFLLALREPWRAKEIRPRLQELNRLSAPHLRLAANQTLQMLNLIELAWEAIDHPKKQNEIEAQLRAWQETKLFGAEVNWAAREALAYIK
jgi:HEAT repeat protein